MRNTKRQQVAFKILEERLVNLEGNLSVCMGEDCKRIGILIKRRKYWMHREENQELYDRAVSSFRKLLGQGGGISHGYCPPCMENYEREMLG